MTESSSARRAGSTSTRSHTGRLHSDRNGSSEASNPETREAAARCDGGKCQGLAIIPIIAKTGVRSAIEPHTFQLRDSARYLSQLNVPVSTPASASASI